MRALPLPLSLHFNGLSINIWIRTASHGSSHINMKMKLTILFIFASISLAQFQSAYENCPIACDPADSDPTSWTYYYALNELDSCHDTVIFQMNLYNAVDDPATHVYYRACTASQQNPTRRVRRQILSFNDTVEAPAPVQLVQSGPSGSSSNVGAAQAALRAIQSYLLQAAMGTSTLFARSGGVVAGMYAGSQINKTDAAGVLAQVREEISREYLPGQLVAQACGSGSALSNETISPQFFGVIVDAKGEVAAVQTALRSWNDAQCLSGSRNDAFKDVFVKLVSGSDISIAPEPRFDSFTPDGSGLATRQSDTCRYTQVQSGDGCFAVSERCGITISELESYNGGENFCSTLQVDQYVCCSPGSLPDFSPQPGGDGSCFAYTVNEGDNCADIATRNQMTVADIENRNSQTWSVSAIIPWIELSLTYVLYYQGMDGLQQHLSRNEYVLVNRKSAVSSNGSERSMRSTDQRHRAPFRPDILGRPQSVSIECLL